MSMFQGALGLASAEFSVVGSADVKICCGDSGVAGDGGDYYDGHCSRGGEREFRAFGNWAARVHFSRGENWVRDALVDKGLAEKKFQVSSF